MDSNSPQKPDSPSTGEPSSDRPTFPSMPLRPPEIHLPDPEQLSGQIAEQVHFALTIMERMGAGMNGMVEDAFYRMGQSAIDTATEMTSELSKTIESLSHSATDLGQSTFDWANQASQTTLRESHKVLDQTLQNTGQAVDTVAKMPQLRQWFNFLKIDWLINLIDRVDVRKATDAVRKLQEQYPNESPAQIAHHIIVEKAVYAGGMGFASSLVPGEAAALLAVDLAATTALQTEMVYQIAAAYGLDLRDPARKGEVLAIFGLALGGSQAVRAGLKMLRFVPMAGAFVGASTNATMMYALGYAACRFYEAKLDTDKLPTETIDALQAESDRYLTNIAINQQTIIDKVLVHMINASYPDHDWNAILPKLSVLQLSSASLEAIAAEIRSPQPLDQLLQNLNRDYATLLLAQCYRIANVDGNQSPEEAQILNTIAERFNLNLDDVKRMVEGT
ncbi:TerB family tellurite resistance protein [Leptolyngbya ohadii]|uniref:TerB family tellurite resistance protein n=1 Tax=Leptolyngbya ohadii TaxID=1962290 RepID=UPI000B59E121|nr:TerB family tellurite resistance protein [Leptolyngbya ohadii]